MAGLQMASILGEIEQLPVALMPFHPRIAAVPMSLADRYNQTLFDSIHAATAFDTPEQAIVSSNDDFDSIAALTRIHPVEASKDL